MLKIRIVDDEPAWIEFVTNTLTQAGYEIATGADAHLYLVSAKRLTHLPKPAVVFTARPTSREAIAAYRAGAINYLVKDWNPETLLTVVNVAPALQHLFKAIAEKILYDVP